MNEKPCTGIFCNWNVSKMFVNGFNDEFMFFKQLLLLVQIGGLSLKLVAIIGESLILIPTRFSKKIYCSRSFRIGEWTHGYLLKM